MLDPFQKHPRRLAVLGVGLIGGSFAMALRAATRRFETALVAPSSAAEEHAAELRQGSSAAMGDDPLAAVEGETHGLDADAGDYLIKGDDEA